MPFLFCALICQSRRAVSKIHKHGLCFLFDFIGHPPLHIFSIQWLISFYFDIGKGNAKTGSPNVLVLCKYFGSNFNRDRTDFFFLFCKLTLDCISTVILICTERNKTKWHAEEISKTVKWWRSTTLLVCWPQSKFNMLNQCHLRFCCQTPQSYMHFFSVKKKHTLWVSWMSYEKTLDFTHCTLLMVTHCMLGTEFSIQETLTLSTKQSITE